MALPSSVALLRAAAVVSLLFCLGHSSGYPWTPGETAEAGKVVADMQRIVFDAEGAQRTYWDFYLGFGLIVSTGLGLASAVLWSIVPIARVEPQRAFAPTACVLVFMLLNTWLSRRFFFLLPAAFAALTALILAIALLTLRRRRAA
jgi:hypothetical protein